MDSSLLTSVLGKYLNGDAAYIAVITFFLCEAIFAAFPIERSRMKQLTSLLIGGLLGFVLLKNSAPVDNLVQGLLAGGGATMVVAKFKGTPSSDTETTTETQTVPAPAISPAMQEPAEHL